MNRVAVGTRIPKDVSHSIKKLFVLFDVFHFHNQSNLQFITVKRRNAKVVFFMLL